ncbi:MAG: hydantoinase/oxoprolinase family protein [Alphaproteobacteria bacterium]|nr:hydantoinase/oxoprolinase family protein [Alphaproteobacteria bacterium]
MAEGGMHYRIGVDIGGTFTDFALAGPPPTPLGTHKRLTTSEDPAEAVVAGVAELLGDRRVPIAEVGAIVHGTTLVTNAVITRRGARTGMLVTAGFRDILEIGTELRYDQFDLTQQFPEPLVPRMDRIEIAERIYFDGRVEQAPDLGEVRAALGSLQERGVEAVAVCLLHAYANPAHEQAIVALATAEYPGLHISASADVLAEMREYHRWTTTTVNAYTQPMVDRYLGRLERGLADLGFRGRLYVMTSNGGMVTPAVARRYPVRLIESGPAAGVLIAAHQAGAMSLPDVLSYDMGGTTAKGAIVRDARPLRTYGIEVARLHEFKKGSGLPLRIPAIDLIEIGAGGGSIAWVDARGVIRVGPESAGADPGPACYGRGGRRATLTDANLALGYLDPASFLGGKMALDRVAAEAALTTDVARPLGVSLVRAAAGIHAVVNEDVARAFRIHAAEQGVDYRRCSMVAFGGSGPIHAAAVARRLRIPQVVFPLGAGVMSAMGLLIAPLSFATARSRLVPLDQVTAEVLEGTFAPLEHQAALPLADAGIPAERIRINRMLDLRYRGQSHVIEVTLPEDLRGAALASALPALFAERYAAVFARSLLEESLEVVTWKVEAVHRDVPFLTLAATAAAAAPATHLVRRPAYAAAGDGLIEYPVYSRASLSRGEVITGPALVEEAESTCVLGPGDVGRIDATRNLIVTIAVRAVS